ncbi:putative O-glycosylation ligase, exosortase A system-associated [Photobacterium aphoticum]|uniref:putative O-glycosylation ligase, exosortase A system-associated n=1 Tax=Photobacterium aphoticum TaxID=754436 RepID=UPI0009E1E077|nr:putative O-glycosylation ligase, exosortase A system-associated [Photobacterium aphoticum]PSU58440.1 putative O-glycosylation ligase, exosortase A system-associated [Photobacterium aphoticum]
MRDILFLGVIACLVLLAFRKPYVAVTLWLWTGLFVPKHWLYGFASGISYNTLFVLITVIVYGIAAYKRPMRLTPLILMMLLFTVHITITTTVTVSDPDYVWSEWVKFSKTLLIILFVSLIIQTRNHFNYLLMAYVFSLGLMGVVEGLKFMATAGGHHIKGPSNNILSDNNHFALALCMVIPLIVYLLGQYKQKFYRLGLITVLILCVLAVLGTQSRGGFIGLTCVGGFFWLKSKRKVMTLLGFGLLTILALQFLPEKWFNRMNTIENAEQDGSFMIRVKAWKMYTLMAMERPLVGGGFRAMQFGYVWRSVADDFEKLSFIESPEPGDRGWAAHSIYFQVLGDHGFLGLGLFLGIIVVAYFTLSNIMRKVKDLERLRWQYHLASMLKLSIVAYCISGAALSLPYAEACWSFFAVVIALDLSMRESLEQIEQEEKTKAIASTDVAHSQQAR